MKTEYPISNKEYPTEKVKKRAGTAFTWILIIPCWILDIEKEWPAKEMRGLNASPHTPGASPIGLVINRENCFPGVL